MNASYVWGSFISVSAVTFVLTDSLRVGFAVGVFAAAGMAFVLSRVSAQWREQLKPYVSASDPGAVADELRAMLEHRTLPHS